MRTKVLTLRFSPHLGRFDDGPLVALQQKVVLEHVREHLVQVGGEAMLLCVATWRERAEGTSATNGTTPTSTAAIPEPVARVEPAAEQRGPATPVGELRADFTAEQQALFDLLRRWRREKAHDEGAPPYVVLTNRQLVELVRQRPHSRAEMGRIAGFGDKKLARHGAELLALLWPDTPAREHLEPAGAPVATTAEAAS